MIPALMWKEFREQGLIVSALTVLGGAILLTVGLLYPPRGDGFGLSMLSDPGFLAFVMLLVTAGVVVGGTLFAGEKEAGTYAFLTLLPVPRWRVWVGKMCGGAVLTLIAATVMFAVAAGTGTIGPVRSLAGWAMGATALVLASFAWGAVGSMWAKNSLTAAGVGAMLGVLTSGVVSPVVVFVLSNYGRWIQNTFSTQGDGSFLLVVVPLVILFALFSIPFIISGWLYTAPDRDRKLRIIFGPKAGANKKRRIATVAPWRFLPAFRASLWICWRQLRGPAIVLTLLGLLSGLSLLIPGTPGVIVWPAVTFFLAVVVGVIGWADEQASGSARFWVERRTPVGRLWLAKMITGLSITVVATICAAVPVVLKIYFMRGDWLTHPSRLLFDHEIPLLRFLLLWPLYGFTAGHLVGLLFRKAIVAVAVALMTGAILASAWLPSLLAGGIHDWQLWLPPLLIVLTARALVWSMAADRIGSGRAMRRLAIGGAAVSTAVCVGLAHRVLEVPDTPGRGDDIAFQYQEIPPFETNEVGREIRRSAVMLTEALTGKSPSSRSEDLVNLPTPTMYGRDPYQALPDVHRRSMLTIVEHGWQHGDEDMKEWLDLTFANGWADVLTDAAVLPLGCVEDASELTTNKPLTHLYGLRGADILLLVHALRRQAEGDPAEYVQAVRTVLALSRNLRNKSIMACGIAARDMERLVYKTLTHWLQRLNDRRDLIHSLLRELVDHDTWVKDDLADIRLAEQVVLRNTIKAPGEVLRRQWFYSFDRVGETARSLMDTEADLIATSWEMPWEKERLDRLVGLGNRTPYLREYGETLFHGLPAVGWIAPIRSFNLAKEFDRIHPLVTADRRGAMISLAVRLHEIEHASTPPDLAALRPEYFTTLPTDPFDDRPMRYRISTGEKVAVSEQTIKPGAQPGEYAEVTNFPIIGNGVPGGVESASPLIAVLGGAVGIDPDAPEQEMADFTLDPTPLAAVTSAAASFVSPTGQVFGTPFRNPVSPPLSGPFTRTVTLSPGTVVIWSVGPDKRDDGGVALAGSRAQFGDLVYVVPSTLSGDRR